jgi:hypothetical protein
VDGLSDELKQLLRETFECAMTDVQICLPGVVEKYDPKTRRADVQPSLKRKMPGGKFMDLSVIPDVPVRFSGSRKYTIHFPLEKGEEVALHFIQRSTDVWRDKGGKDIEDTDPRRFDFCDCYAVSGLEPIEFIPVTEDGLNIVHKTNFDGDFISSITMDDDKVEMKYKEKADVVMKDDNIIAKTEKCSVEMSADVVTAKNSQLSMKLNGAKASLKNGSKSLYTIWRTFLQTLQTTQPTTLGSPAAHNWNPAIAQAIGTADTDLSALLEA